jgi:hypothetical protein
VWSSAPTIVRSDQNFVPEFGQARSQPPEIKVDLGRVAIADKDREHLIQLDLDAIRMASLALSVGAVWWATRATGLLASLLSSLPAWRNFDPLPVLARGEDEEREEEWVRAYDAQADEEAEAEENALKRTLSNRDSQPIELEKLR